jgi:hypothetical protein
VNSDSQQKLDFQSTSEASGEVPENQTEQEHDLPPLVEPRHRIHAERTKFQTTLAVTEWFEDWLGSKAYGAPRIFDLYTLMAIMFAFALLFGGLRLIKPLLADQLATATVVVSLFLLLTGICQMLLWGGQKPRLASIVAGPFLWSGLGVAVALMHADLFSSQPVRMLQAILPQFAGIACSSIMGIFVGYVSGGLVAGVFFVADKLRNSIRPPSAQSVPSASLDAMWEAAPEDAESTEKPDP